MIGLLQAPIIAYIFPILHQYGVLVPLLDALELNLLVTIILGLMLATLNLINALLVRAVRYVWATDKAKSDNSSEASANSDQKSSDTTTVRKPSLPFSRTRPKVNKLHQKK